MSDVQGYILGDGGIIGAEDLERFAKSASAAKRLKDDPFRYRADDVVPPPEDLGKLARFLETNTEHYRCVKAKATDVAGSYEIVPREEGKQGSDEQRRALEAFLGDCNPKLTFEELLERVWTDYEAVGNGYLEVVRSVDGTLVTGLEHVAATTIRARKDGDGFLQRRGAAKIYFREFGDPRAIRADDGTVTAEKLGEAERATELLPFINYHPRSDFYGLPDFLPALGAIVGNLQVRDYNLQFFENNAVPQYAIIVQGSDLNPGLKDAIASYFREHIKGQAHKTLLIPVPDKDTKVTLVPLGAKINEGGFQVYRRDNRDEILRAHGMPPHRIGIVESGNLGGGTGESQTATYKDAIIEPRQTRLERRLNDKIIRDGLGVTDWIIKFADIDTEDTDRNSQIAERMTKSGMWSLKEGRVFVGKFADDDYKGGDEAFILVNGVPKLVKAIGQEPEPPAPTTPPVPPAVPPPPAADERADEDLAKRAAIRKAARDEAVERHAGDYAALLAQFLANQGEQLAGAIATALAARPVTKAADDDVTDRLDLALWQEQLAGVVEEQAATLFAAGQNGAYAGLGLEGAFDLENPRAVAWAEGRAAELLKTGPDAATSIVESTRRGLRDLIAKALGEGATYTEVAQRIRDSYQFSPERAANIARYELGTAYVQGNLAGWEESGVVKGSRWSTMRDDRVRPEHQANEAAGVVALGKAFPSGHKAPPTDPLCRCDLIPEVSE